MLVLDVAKIPEEGLPIDAVLETGEAHLDGEDSFHLEAGGRVKALVEKGEDEAVHVRGQLSAAAHAGEVGRVRDWLAARVEPHWRQYAAAWAGA